MTCNEFNEKWGDYLEYGHYGMAIDNQEVIAYLDEEFQKEVKVNHEFKYAQIKIKFGYSRVYADSDKTWDWEGEIDKIIGYDKLINRNY